MCSEKKNLDEALIDKIREKQLNELEEQRLYLELPNPYEDSLWQDKEDKTNNEPRRVIEIQL